MNIRVNINDNKSLKNAVKEIKRYQRELKSKTKEFVERVGELGIEIANTHIGIYNIPSEIKNSITLVRGDTVVSGSSIKIVVNDETAMYWEFGTGMMGENSPHPESDTWVYDVNNHGLKGWYYSKSQGKLTQWSVERGNAYKTYGMKAQPFMFNTIRDLTYDKWQQICDIASEVFGN